MILRCSFITSSYLSTSLRISKLRSSTVPCARSTAFETIFDSSGMSSSNDLSITRCMRPVANNRMSSSSSER